MKLTAKHFMGVAGIERNTRGHRRMPVDGDMQVMMYIGSLYIKACLASLMEVSFGVQATKGDKGAKVREREGWFRANIYLQIVIRSITT